MTDLTVDTQDEVAVVTLDRPQRRNALSSAFTVAIAGTMSRLVWSSRLGLTWSDVLRLGGRPQLKRALATFVLTG
jgi:hypothetical protein